MCCAEWDPESGKYIIRKIVDRDWGREYGNSPSAQFFSKSKNVLKNQPINEKMQFIEEES